ncbi:MAG: GlcNAc-PI de-N-acetylase [Myxococcales bacterium]|nr:GlcNAc-PI de-N-acetylase [Myxococcales bacterium]|tara:strand:+ start:2210 stop:2899 length:690 start_codon:yes stop_codon:yes gene_type:complete
MNTQDPKNILVIAAHPDDEVLGMGGTIAKHVHHGDKVAVLYLSTGVASRGTGLNQMISRRKDAAKKASEVLGFEILGFEDFPDNAFDTVSLLSVAQAIEGVKSQVNPDVVYTHHGGDLNVDHRIACQAVLTAFRAQPGESCSRILSFEVNSSTEWMPPSVAAPFLPDTFVDIAKHIPELEEACHAYHEEMRPAPHTRSVAAVLVAAQHRGHSVGLAAAEAFMTLRQIIR